VVAALLVPLCVELVDDPLCVGLIDDPLCVGLVDDPLCVGLVDDPLRVRLTDDPLSVRLVAATSHPLVVDVVAAVEVDVVKVANVVASTSQTKDAV
jgi:hypothetical protein